MLIAKLLAPAVPTFDSQQNVPTHYKDIVCLPVQQQCGRVGVFTHQPSQFETIHSRQWSLIQTSSTGYIYNFLLLSLIFTMTNNFITFHCQVGPIH